MAKTKDTVYGTTVRIKAALAGQLSTFSITRLVDLAAELDVDITVDVPR
jgi:hypothetical protein